ncbi:hypothetical protein ABMC89_06790 [Sulfitobacter sp. HNIBRBA3233]|uniref:hypothetical protein n=1 Tax=Sulfitobacter marinivivus TaxID=3158558 RepID=UPI0032DEDE12
MVDLNSRPKTAIMFQYVSRADLVSVDFWHLMKLWQKVDESLTSPISGVGVGRKIAPFVLHAQKAMQETHRRHAQMGYPNRSLSVRRSRRQNDKSKNNERTTK